MTLPRIVFFSLIRNHRENNYFKTSLSFGKLCKIGLSYIKCRSQNKKKTRPFHRYFNVIFVQFIKVETCLKYNMYLFSVILMAPQTSVYQWYKAKSFFF